MSPITTKLGESSTQGRQDQQSNTQPTSSTSPPRTDDPVADNRDVRLRFLRACDRCRRRKMKCDSAFPCTKCQAANVECTFDNQPTSTRMTAVAQPAPAQGGTQTGKRKREEDDDTRPVLEHNDTSHFYVTQDGVTRFAGSASGLPLLDATRRHVRPAEEPRTTDEGEPDWSWLSSLLSAGPSTSPVSQQCIDSEELEYFPGHDLMPSEPNQDIFSMITMIIPPDLLTSLVKIYFITLHPSNPILHPATFYADFYKWEDCAFAALVVSMCMLASRYTSDVRVRADPGNPATAGVRYFALFRQLRDQAVNHDNVIYAVQSLLLAAKFHCVDHTPHAMAQGLFAEAAARCYDGGLHREISAIALCDSIEKETRTRTAWACFLLDKQLAVFCGRPILLHLTDYDVSLPEPYDETEATTTEMPPDEDKQHVMVFTHLITLSAVLEKALGACSHPPIFKNSRFLNKLSASAAPIKPDAEMLQDVTTVLQEWRSQLPSALANRSMESRLSSPSYSVTSEQLASMEFTVELLIAGRKMQLATLLPPNDRVRETAAFTVKEGRADLLVAAKNIVNVAVHLGAKKLLSQCEIVLAYRLLLAGRMLLAVLLSSRADNDIRQQEIAQMAVQAVSVLLRHIATALPIAMGAAEVFDETCRVCRVHITPTTSKSTSRPRWAWYRPIGFRKPDRQDAGSQGGPSPHQGFSHLLDGSTVDQSVYDPMALLTDFSPVNAAFAGGNIPLPFLNNLSTSLGHHQGQGQGPGEADHTDFSWLMPGGHVPYYMPQ